MNVRARLAAALAVAALAACNSTTTTQAGALFADPSSVAVFRGVTTRSGRDTTGTAPYPYRPYLAVANAASNDISIIDGIDDTLITAPVPTRSLVYPAPGRPMILAAGDLGDGGPDLLVVVTAGDLPWLGGTQLRVVSTWDAYGTIENRTDGAPAVDFAAAVAPETGQPLGGAADVLALQVLPAGFDPVTSATGVKLVAVLAGERIATVTFSRASRSQAIDVNAAQATVRVSRALGFQPLAVAAIPGDRTRVFAASSETLPGGTQGVAVLDVTGEPVVAAELDAHAPTRLVAAGRLIEGAMLDPGAAGTTDALGNPLSAATDATPFAGREAVERVWAILDESGCGPGASIACGLVALDVASRGLAPDPTPAGSFQAAYRAPIPFTEAVALAASGPPAFAPSAAEPQFAGTFMRIAKSTATWQTTAVAAVATANGAMTYVDLGRWNVPSGQDVHAAVKGATVKSYRPPGTTGSQYLTLMVPAADPNALATVAVPRTETAVLVGTLGLTGGFTPSEPSWVVAYQGVLPGLSSRRAEVAGGKLALQVTGATGPQEVVRVWDPTLGVTVGDIVVLEPTGLSTCRTFEARVDAVNAPTSAQPGGSVSLGHRILADPEAVTTKESAPWNGCVDALKNGDYPAASYRATIRAGGYVLTRGSGSAAVHVGRPELARRFAVQWSDAEESLAATCTLPPAKPWTGSPACDDASGCRGACMELQRIRLARRIGYVTGDPYAATGPALAFTVGLDLPRAKVPRDIALIIATTDGRAPYSVAPSAGFAVQPKGVLVFDRSPWANAGGVRFIVPYAGATIIDSTPSLPTNGTTTIH